MGRVGTHTRPGIIPKSTACAPLVHWNHYSSERGRGESPPAEARSTRLFPDQSKSTSLALQIIQDFYLGFHSKLFLCPSILFILQFICIYIYVKLEKFTKKKEKYMRIFRSCQSYDNEVIMIHAKVFRDPFSRNDSSKLQKNRGKESGSNVERSRHFTLDFATILFSPNRSWYGQRERETRQKTGVTVPANSVGTAVLAKKWKLHRDDFHVAVEATISRAARVRQEC